MNIGLVELFIVEELQRDLLATGKAKVDIERELQSEKLLAVHLGHRYPNATSQHRLSQATNSSTNGGRHWKCMAREHPFEGNYAASTNSRDCQTFRKQTVQNTPRRLRGLRLSPRVKDDCLEPSASSTDCCYQGLSLATVVTQRTYNFERPLVKMATGCVNSSNLSALR